MSIGRYPSVRHLCLVASGIKDVLDTLIAGSGRKGECFPAGGFQPIDRILVGQFQKPHTAAVGLLFYTFRGKDRIYYLIGTGTDSLRPFAESVAIPFKVLLVGRRHMICNSHINFALYIFMWN